MGEPCSDLKTRYDEMLNIKERASERYKSDYKKWKNYYNSIFSDDPEDRKQERQPGITPQEKRKREGVLQCKRERLLEGNFAASIEPCAFVLLSLFGLSSWLMQQAGDESSTRRAFTLGREDRNNDKENDGTPMPLPKRRRLGSENLPSPSKKSRSPVKPRLPIQPLRDSLLRSVTNLSVPSSSPTVFLDKNNSSTRTPTPLAFRPLPDDIFIKEEPS